MKTPSSFFKTFFLTELIRVLEGGGDADELDRVPETVQAVIGVRTSQLPRDVADTLEVAAVIGPSG